MRARPGYEKPPEPFDYLDTARLGHEETRPSAPAAKHGTETGSPTTINQQKDTAMMTRNDELNNLQSGRPVNQPTPETIQDLPNVDVLLDVDGSPFLVTRHLVKRRGWLFQEETLVPEGEVRYRLGIQSEEDGLTLAETRKRLTDLLALLPAAEPDYPAE